MGGGGGEASSRFESDEGLSLAVLIVLMRTRRCTQLLSEEVYGLFRILTSLAGGEREKVVGWRV